MTADVRLALLSEWLREQFPGFDLDIRPASADASFRRYFRITLPDGATHIAMDAPPPQEDCRPFVAVQTLFAGAGAHVPAVRAQDLQRGFLLLSDLGSTTYLDVLDGENAAALYFDATTALVDIQRASRPGVLPEYDRDRLLAEMELFPVWYIGRHLTAVMSDAETTALYEVFDRILDVNTAEPQVFVHRDYHSRNLMVTHPNPGVLDFQDAVYGPISYDLASLFKDAYIAWDEERTLDWLIRYWQDARRAGLPVRANFADFHRDYEFMGAQRHLKVLGIFARLYHRDGKDGYLKDMPRVMKHLRATAQRYRELAPLAHLLDRLEGSAPQVGYTF
ncbi:aminoglycoside phosphotransferase family protein [Methyloversatilis thermotolerans]|uniref:aminoglycoside phosphotransferase family protein n=1 Tax=Methyloversatilis thermotolerans TaxID=1346290 RepID=UPI00037FE129|nr:phosphotransferase [Methyloversatilis thermotolerans]